MKQTLKVYLHDQFVGNLSSENGLLSFIYDEFYQHKIDAKKISVSLPLQKEAFDHRITTAFFSGLLPDEDVRRRLAQYLGLSEKNTFALLKSIGGECAGAISVHPAQSTPDSKSDPTYRILEDTEVDDILSSLDKHPLQAGEKGVRMSGAGAQDKLMIAFIKDKMAIPTGNTPSTHIIKPLIKGLNATVHNEFFCMRLAKAVKLPTPDVNIYWVKDKPYYLIERYDRLKTEQGTIKRLHQEDFCQAMHLPPEMKYESEGGPNLENCFSLLENRIKTGCMSGRNKLILLQGIIFNFLIGNGDAHGKNFSLLYHENTESLAPFYDLLCTIIYGDFYKSRMAMQIRGKYKFKEITLRQWEYLREISGFKPRFFQKQLFALSNEVLKAAETLKETLNQDPKTASTIYTKIFNIIVNHHRQITHTGFIYN